MKSCALVGAVDFNTQYYLRTQTTYDTTYAVDAGYAQMLAIECTPDYVVGDFDSLGYVPEHPMVEVHPQHKDESDMELAFEAAHQAECTDVTVYGALGGRLDHTLANLQVMAAYAERGMNVRAIADTYQVRFLCGPGSMDLPMLPQGVVSVFPSGDGAFGVSEWGMEYPLDDAVLSNRNSLGLSNELQGEPAGIRVQEGTLIIVCPLEN